MKILLYTLLSLAFTSTVSAQTDAWQRLYDHSTTLLDETEEHMPVFLDSLLPFRSRSNEDRVLIDLLTARWMRHSGRTPEAHHILDTIQIDRGLGYHYFSYLRHYQHAKVYKEFELFDQARVECLSAIRSAEQANMPDEALQMELLACEIDLHGDRYHQAQVGFDRALSKARGMQHNEGVCRALIGLGNVYYYQEKDSAALTYYYQAFDEARDGNDPGLMVSALLNIGAALSYTSGSDHAISLYRSFLDTAAVGSVGPRLKADVLCNMASMYSDLEDHRTAVALIDSALFLYGTLRDTSSMAQPHLFKATALWNLGQQEEAIRMAKLARTYTRGTDLKAKATKKAAEYLQKVGRDAEALDLLNEYANLADSLSRAKFNKRIAGAQVQFETERKERRITEQEQALALASAVDRRKNIQRLALGVGVLALTVIALLLARGLRNRKRLAVQERTLHTQQVDKLMNEQEIKAINAMLEGQEKERDRVAKDLHDRLGSMLSAIKMQVGALEGGVEVVRTEQEAQHRKVERLLDEAVGEVRRISHDMIAVTLARFGLAKALEDLCASVRVTGRLAVELQLFGLEERLERSMEIAVYRMVQELVSNVLKHAKASEISISLTREPGRLSVMVTDDGKGFDPTTAQEGMGIQNVRSRAASLGAVLRVDSKPGAGTTVSVECPVVE